MNKKVLLKIISLSFLIIFAILIIILFNSRIYIDDVVLGEYGEDKISLSVKIKSTTIFSGKKYCYLSDKDEKPSSNSKDWVLAQNDTCILTGSFNNHYLYVKDSFGNITNLNVSGQKFLKNFETGLIYDYYMIPGMEMDLNSLKNYYVLNNNYSFVTDQSNIKLENGKVTALSKGDAVIKIGNEKDLKGINIHVTDSIGDALLEQNKPLIKCNQFSYGEAKFIDSILANKVKEAGEGSRAAAIAVARFITLEFKYRVPYFFENGRLNNYDPYKHVDGEGRYYHKGLYLNESKYNELDESFVGPAIWGCDLLNFTTMEPYIAGEKYPNGLDCSGFISWLLYNAGFDMGDIGAGIDDEHLDFTDLGERVAITNDLMNSGRVKVGDLIGSNGHIAIIAGWDENNIYIAESLNTTGGVVMTTVKRSELTRSIYKHIILMDDFYKNNDNYTDMW